MTETKDAHTQEHQPGREHEMAPRPDYEPRFPGSGRLAGKTAIVTGGDSGIGRAVAVLFAREGANVAIIYLEEDRDAEDTKRAIENEGAKCLLVRGDVGEQSFCRDAVARIIDELGTVDVLVNNAAEQHLQGDFEKISSDQIMETFRTNIFGYLFLTQAVLPHLADGSAIVNTTSVTAYRGSPALIDYSATKGAIVAFTRSLAKSLADRNIRVNAVAPGPIWTPLIPATFTEEGVEKFGQKTPLGRAGQPNEVASCHLFLACADASYMTGQVLHPNGGDIVGG